MSGSGRDVLDIGKGKIGQKYILGAQVPLNNPNWRGPWDCAEFTSWCAYQAYGLVFGAGRPRDIGRAEPYSGHWHDEARKAPGAVISWREALTIPGAALIRRPVPGKIGHVAFAIGDGDQTLEARSKADGVGIFRGAADRPWTIGCLLPGVEYDRPTGPPPTVSAGSQVGLLWLKRPIFRGPDVVALQRALKAKGVDPGPIDGEYGSMTAAAVTSFQAAFGLEVDGTFGRNTAGKLNLAFPIQPTTTDISLYNSLTASLAGVHLSTPSSAAAIDPVVAIKPRGNSFEATTRSGFSFLVGSPVDYVDDMARRGLMQRRAEIQDSLQFGVYRASDFTGQFQDWAHFIQPTLTAEGAARFSTLNTYDRAAFTFGAPQLAAHTPRHNLIEYVRLLLALPNADQHFPELQLHANAAGEKTVHLKKGGSLIDLEVPIKVTRPNGVVQTQIPKFMAYLNSSPTAVDDPELLAAARLMNWLRQDSAVAALQIKVFIGQAQRLLATAKTKMPGFTGANWREALWIMDILHQGRGSYREMAAALAAPQPEAALARIGSVKYAGRVKTIGAEIKALDSAGVLTGFTV